MIGGAPTLSLPRLRGRGRSRSRSTSPAGGGGSGWGLAAAAVAGLLLGSAGAAADPGISYRIGATPPAASAPLLRHGALDAPAPPLPPALAAAARRLAALEGRLSLAAPAAKPAWPRPLPAPSKVPPLAERIIAAEGGPAANPRSSAAGYGQFLRGTWLDLFGRLYPQLTRLLTPEQILALRDIRPLAAQLTEHYAELNGDILRQRGLPASEATLSLAHAIGAGGAIDVLTAPPGQPVASLLGPQAMAANPNLRGMTALDLRNWAGGRVLVPAAARLPAVPPAPPPVPKLSPKQDFRLANHARASAVLAANAAAIARVKAFIAEGGAAPRQPILEALRDAAKRPGYAELALIASGGRFAQLSPEAACDVARVLLDKLRQEDAAILDIAQRR